VAQSKTSDGVTVKTTLNRVFKKEKAGPKEIISAVVEPKFEWKEQNVEFTGKLSTSNDFNLGFSVKDLAIHGSKIEVTSSQSDKDGIAAQITGSYKDDRVAAKVGVAYPISLVGVKKEKKPIKLNGELVLHHPSRAFIGTNVSVDLDASKSVIGEGVIGYSQDHWRVVARGNYESKTETTLWGVSFFNRVSEFFSMSADFEADQAWNRGPICSVGGEYRADGASTLKAKWSVNGTAPSKLPEMRLGLSAKQKLSPFVTATLGADLNIRSLMGESIGDAHSFGFELKFQE